MNTINAMPAFPSDTKRLYATGASYEGPISNANQSLFPFVAEATMWKGRPSYAFAPYVTDNLDGTFSASYYELEYDNGYPITSRNLFWRVNGGAWNTEAAYVAGTPVTHGGADTDTLEVQVQLVNSAGAGPRSTNAPNRLNPSTKPGTVLGPEVFEPQATVTLQVDEQPIRLMLLGQSEQRQFARRQLQDPTPTVIDETALKVAFSSAGRSAYAHPENVVSGYVTNAQPFTGTLAHLSNWFATNFPGKKFELALQACEGTGMIGMVSDASTDREWLYEWNIMEALWPNGEQPDLMMAGTPNPDLLRGPESLSYLNGTDTFDPGNWGDTTHPSDRIVGAGRHAVQTIGHGYAHFSGLDMRPQFDKATFNNTYIEVWIDGQAIYTDRGGTNGLAVSGFYWASGRAPAELHNGRVRVFYNAGKDPIPGGASLIWGNTAGVEGVKTDLSPNAIWRDWPLVTVSGVPDVCVVNSVPDGLLDVVPFDGVGLTHLHRIQKAAGTAADTAMTVASIASDGSPLLIAIGNRSNTTDGTGGISGLTLDGVDISSGWLAGDQVLNSYMDVYLVESPPVGAALNLDVTFASSSGAMTGADFPRRQPECRRDGRGGRRVFRFAHVFSADRDRG